MKTKNWIITIILSQAFVQLFAQQSPFIKQQLRYEYYSSSTHKYLLSVGLNKDLKYDGECLIYDRKDSSVVGRMQYKNGQLVDSAIVNTPSVKLKAFFVYPSETNNKYVPIADLDMRGIPHGEFVLEKFDNGIRIYYEKCTYVYGVKTGPCEIYECHKWNIPLNGIWYRYEMKNDEFDGSYLKHSVAGDTLEYGRYLNGKRDGCWIIYSPYTSVKELSCYREGVRHGAHKEWFNGKLITDENYNDGKDDGLWHTWSRREGIMTSETYYKNGLVVGLSRRWFDSGVLSYSAEHDSLGDFNGTVTEYYTNGNKHSRQDYVKGHAEGTFMRWNEDGVVTARIQCHLGDRQGKSETFFDNGKPEELAYYSDNKYNGVVKQWNEEGELIRHELFKNGELVESYVNKMPEDDDRMMYGGESIEDAGSDDFYVPTFSSNYVNLKYDLSSLECISKRSEALVDNLNTWYQDLSKKKKMNCSTIQRIDMTYQIEKNSVIIEVIGANKKLSEEIQEYLLQRVPGTSCLGIFPCTIKVTIPFDQSKE